MVYAEPFVRMTINGGVSNEDIWSNGFSITSTAGEGAAGTFDAIDPEDFSQAIVDFYINATRSMNTYNTLETLKFALIGVDGKYVTDPKIYDFGDGVNGNGEYAVSPQDSMVISLLTNVRRGLAYRGRFYLPAGFCEPEAATGRVSTADTTSLSTQSASFINTLNGILTTTGTSGYISVVSNQRTGAQNFVTGVEVGNLMDNQRRRRNRLEEVYVKSPLVP